MYSKPKHKSSAQKRKDKREQGDVTAKLTKLEIDFFVIHRPRNRALTLAMLTCSGSRSRRLTIAHLPHHHHCHLAPQVKLYPWQWLCNLLLQPARRRGWMWLCPVVVQQFPQGPQPIGDSGAIETPDAKIKSYIIATGLCRPTGPFPRHQGNRFNPLLSSLCRCQAVHYFFLK